MRYKGRPGWIAEADQDAMEETARRVERYLKKTQTGRRCPDRKYIVKKLREEYAKYGKHGAEKNHSDRGPH